jgi:hypothetical protein
MIDNAVLVTHAGINGSTGEESRGDNNGVVC